MAPHLRTIACLIDFSDLSSQGLSLAVNLASRFSAVVLAFHAVHLPNDQIEGSDYPQSRPQHVEALSKALSQLDHLVEATGQVAVPVVVSGEPVSEMVKLAATQPIDLVIAPSRGVSALKRLFTGTLVERLVRRIVCPVLVCRPKAGPVVEPLVKSVVAAIPEPDMPGPVMAKAVATALAFGADLHLVHVCMAPPDVDRQPYDLAQQNHDRRLCRHLLQAAGIAGADKTKTHAIVLTGTPAEAIGTYTARLGAGLVVVGVRRIGPVAKTVIGSTTEALLRAGSCCLLTLPADRD